MAAGVGVLFPKSGLYPLPKEMSEQSVFYYMLLEKGLNLLNAPGGNTSLSPPPFTTPLHSEEK